MDAFLQINISIKDLEDLQGRFNPMFKKPGLNFYIQIMFREIAQ